MSAILTPADENEIADMVREANAAITPLEIQGGGTRSGFGRPVQAAKTLSLKELSGITLYEPGALTLVARAGTPVATIEKTLAAEGQQLAFEPMDHRALYASKGEPTIGGVVAANVSGPRRIQAGACRDALIGVRFIDGRGEIIKNGGRVMKNVTGLDLVKLMAGSHGTLGVISEVSFKVLPVNERAATLAFHGLSSKEAVGILCGALGSPFEITGAAHLPQNSEGPLTLLRVEGFASQVDYRLERLKATIGTGLECSVIEGAEHERLWRFVRDAEMFKGTDNPVWRLSLKPSDAPAIEEALAKKTDAKIMFDWGGGLIWVGVDDAENGATETIRALVSGFGGHATLMRGPEPLRGSIAPFQPQAKPVARLSAAIRGKFDPGGILNPGRMVA